MSTLQEMHGRDEQKESKWPGRLHVHSSGDARKRRAKGKQVAETLKRREPACMGIYEEMHGKDEQRKASGQDSGSYMRHLKGESLHVWAFMRRCTERKEKVYRECQGYKCKGYPKRNIKVIF